MPSGECEVTPGRTLADEELVDNEKLNDLSRPTVKLKAGSVGAREIADGVITSDKLDPDISNQLGVPDNSVTTNKLVAGAVTSVKIADAAVTAAKLDAGAVHGQTELAGALADGDEFLLWDESAGALRRVTKAALAGAFQPAGAVVQTKFEKLSSHLEITADIPTDDSIPQNTEGELVLEAKITPGSSSSKVLVMAIFYGTPSNNYNMVAALFRSGQTGAIAAKHGGLNGGIAVHLMLQALDAPATTSEVTYSLRAGITNGFLYTNGDNNKLMSTAGYCSILLQEIKG